MASAFNNVANIAIARFLLVVIFASLAGIAVLLAFIIGRRWIRSRYFARRDAIAAFYRQHWNELLSATSLNGFWPSGPLAQEVLENILLDRIEVASGDELPAVVDCLRRTGILDRRIDEARRAAGWKKHAALVVLGRTRAVEAIPSLAEGLDSPDMETRIAAARGLGKVARPEAAAPLLERIADEQLNVPVGILKNSLLSCCASAPELLTRALRLASGSSRELLARVLAEVAETANVDELLVMVSDPSAELRCSAARALARLSPADALLPLCQLAYDKEWFVRLRAVVALAGLVDQGAAPVLVRLLSDRNRMVRQRAAWALIRSQRLVPYVLREVIDGGDNYGLQAVVAELDQCGLYRAVVEEVRDCVADGERIVAALERARSRLSPVAEVPSREEVVVA